MTLLNIVWGFLFCFFATGFCSTTPVIFIHRGDSDYLEHSLRQAKQYSDDVILIGDTTNDHFPDVTHFNLNDYFQGAAAFENDYLHMSSNSYFYELFCIQRWYILKEFLEKHKINQCFYCDSDVMIYCDISQTFSTYDCDVALPNIEGYSGHNSFWTANALTHFCNFSSLFFSVRENRSLWEQKFRSGEHNFCDMTLITEFVRALGQPEMTEGTLDQNLLESQRKIVDLMNNPKVKVSRLLSNNTVFDLCNIGHPEIGTYQRVQAYGATIKNIRWVNNQPYCFNLKKRVFLRFNTLHCQGDNKRLMQFLRRERASPTDETPIPTFGFDSIIYRR